MARTLLIANTVGPLEGLNVSMLGKVNINSQFYKLADVTPKFDGTGYWLDIEAIVNCSTWPALLEEATGYMNGKGLIPPISVVVVEDMIAEGYIEPNPILK